LEQVVVVLAAQEATDARGVMELLLLVVMALVVAVLVILGHLQVTPTPVVAAAEVIISHWQLMD
jgi:hypothetical protein